MNAPWPTTRTCQGRSELSGEETRMRGVMVPVHHWSVRAFRASNGSISGTGPVHGFPSADPHDCADAGEYFFDTGKRVLPFL